MRDVLIEWDSGFLIEWDSGFLLQVPGSSWKVELENLKLPSCLSS